MSVTEFPRKGFRAREAVDRDRAAGNHWEPEKDENRLHDLFHRPISLNDREEMLPLMTGVFTNSGSERMAKRSHEESAIGSASTSVEKEVEKRTDDNEMIIIILLRLQLIAVVTRTVFFLSPIVLLLRSSINSHPELDVAPAVQFC
jgi:hypothetical protein